MKGFKVFLRGEDISEQVESLSVGSVSDYMGGVYAVTEIKHINGCIEVYDFDDVAVTKCDKKPFDISEHKFSDEDLVANLNGEIIELEVTYQQWGGHINGYSEEEKAVNINKKDAIAIAKALGVTGEDLK